MSAPAASITAAVATLRRAGVVAIPTETVYGLAADARSEVAVAKVFALKGRPATNPLIVHVSSVQIAERYAVLDERARRLFAAFSPGPLSIVLPLRPGAGIARAATAGLATVGIRIPRHPAALELLRAFDGPLAAPSANQSNHVSPTTAGHVREEFGEQVWVLDGGPCDVGLESTVLDLSQPDRAMILRPGAITREQIEAHLGSVEMFSGHVAATVAAVSPGQHEKHYAPRAPAWRVGSNEGVQSSSPRAAVIVIGRVFERSEETLFARLSSSPTEAARAFYATLRDVDARRPSEIFIEMPPDAPEWAALRDRITRATRPLAERPTGL